MPKKQALKVPREFGKVTSLQIVGDVLWVRTESGAEYILTPDNFAAGAPSLLDSDTDCARA